MRSSPGMIERFDLPGGPFVRVDSGFTAGSAVSPYYDSLLAKVIVWGPDRPTALARMARALRELTITGVTTTASFARAVLATPEFQAGDYHTTWLEAWMRDRKASGVGACDG